MAETVDQEAINQMIQGKRHLLIKDYYSAVQSFEKVCQLLDTKYGRGSEHCGDAYLNYGIALLELARQETGANEGLVNAKINDPSGSEDSDDDDDEEGGDGEEEEEEEEADNDEGTQGSGGKTDEEGKKTDTEEDLVGSDKDEQESEKKEENDVESVKVEELPDSSSVKDIKSTGEDDDKVKKEEKQMNGDGGQVESSESASVSQADLDQPSTSSGIKSNGVDDDDEGDPTNAEIAFDVLTSARQIFERQLKDGQDVKYKLAETLQKLGEIATEWENNELAIDLLTECLSLRKESLPDDDRLIAETYYHIGNAHSFISQIDEANEWFQKAMDVIKMRIENKKKALEDEANKDVDTQHSIKEEINELEALLPEMMDRIMDRADQMMATVKDALKMAVSDKEEEERAAKLKAMESKPVNNISHLVKRKHVDAVETNGSTNGAGTKKLCTNEHQAKEMTSPSDTVEN